MNPSTPQKVLMEFCKDKRLREELFNNPGLSNNGVGRLLDCFTAAGLPIVPGRKSGFSSEKLHRMPNPLACNLKCKAEVLVGIYSIGDKLAQEEVLAHNNCPEELSRVVFMGGEEKFQMAVIYNPKTTNKMLLELGEQEGLLNEVKNAIRERGRKGLEL